MHDSKFLPNLPYVHMVVLRNPDISTSIHIKHLINIPNFFYFLSHHITIYFSFMVHKKKVEKKKGINQVAVTKKLVRKKKTKWIIFHFKYIIDTFHFILSLSRINLEHSLGCDFSGPIAKRNPKNKNKNKNCVGKKIYTIFINKLKFQIKIWHVCKKYQKN